MGNSRTEKRKRQKLRARQRKYPEQQPRSMRCDAVVASETEPDWDGQCEVCGGTPIVPITGMCGLCTFGEAETIGGNW